jgi:cytochrome c biogenesis protein CcdA
LDGLLSIEIDPFALIESTWWLGIPIAFVAGLFLGMSPLSLPITGTAAGLGISGAVGGRGAGVKLVAAFGAGMILVYTAVGFAAGQIDTVIDDYLRPYAGIGYLLIAALLLGLAGWLLYRPAAFCTACAKPLKTSPTVLGAFLAGIPGGLVNCPACAAVVTGVAASAAQLGRPLYSGAVMFALGAGHIAVLVAGTWFVTRRWTPSARWRRLGQRSAAVLLILIAAYFLYLGRLNGFDTGPRLP